MRARAASLALCDMNPSSSLTSTPTTTTKSNLCLEEIVFLTFLHLKKRQFYSQDKCYYISNQNFFLNIS